LHWAPYDSASKNRANKIQTGVTIFLMAICVAFVIELQGNYLRIIAEKVWVFGFIGMMAFILISMLYEAIVFCKEKAMKKKND